MSTDNPNSAAIIDAPLISPDHNTSIDKAVVLSDEHVVDEKQSRKKRKTGDMGDDGAIMEATKEGEKTMGRLLPLKTTLETRMRESLVDVYVTKVPVKKASACLNIIREILPNDGGLDMQHLRRFAKEKDVPESVKVAFKNLEIAQKEPLGLLEETKETVKTVAPMTAAELFVVVGSTNAITEQTVTAGLSASITNPYIVTLPVPLLAPTTIEQAKLWSSVYWPTVYKKSNPFGPHLSLLTRTADEISVDVDRWMTLAKVAAQEAKRSGDGEAVGVVIVERRNGVARPIAVAADARWRDWPLGGGSGNVTAHAAMRAIAMVAEGLKERELRAGLKTPAEMPAIPDIFQDLPASGVERKNYDTTKNEHGYLCFDLEIYCTHEPCVMCSMAIIHSRFGKLVFGKRMRKTGAIVADEDGLGCGLWWRKELNWTMLAWQYVLDPDHDENVSDGDLHA